jgi:hypothetical protein
LWYFPEIIVDIAGTFRDKRTYFTDDTLRTLHLYAKVLEKTGIRGVVDVLHENLRSGWQPERKKRSGAPPL